MKPTVGEWRMQNGRKAIVACINETAGVDPYAVKSNYAIGWIDGWAAIWGIDGNAMGGFARNSNCDIVEKWVEPVPWDWSTTPPWLNGIIQGPSGQWYLYESGVKVGNDGILFNASRSIPIPKSHAPKWSGDWKQSLTLRPGYKEVVP